MTDSDALIKAATELSKELYTHSSDIEKARRIPADISSKLAKAGFYRLGAPKSLGGLEAAPAVSSKIFEILAQGDAASAWVSFIATTSCTALAMIPHTSAAEIFSHPEQLITGVFAPTGSADKVDGGFRVSGRWQWGSGSQNAEWIIGGCMLVENGEAMLDSNGAPRSQMMIMHRDEIEFIDTWHVAGLCGSGSLDYEAKNVFVPQERVVGLQTSDAAPSPLYAFPNMTFLALGISAVCLGIARAAIDELTQLATEKRRVSASKTIAEQALSQVKLAQAEADLRSSRLLYYDALDQAWQSAVAGDGVSLEQRRDIRLATTNAAIKSAAIVDEMYTLGGGSAVYETSRLQRHFRDIHVAKSHIMVAPSTLQTLGRLFFGLETNAASL